MAENGARHRAEDEQLAFRLARGLRSAGGCRTGAKNDSNVRGASLGMARREIQVRIPRKRANSACQTGGDAINVKKVKGEDIPR